MGEKPVKQKIVVPEINLEEMKRSMLLSSVPPSPSALPKSPSVKHNCLCSPTTHAGSFRCRHHRNSALTPSNMSVGSRLSELASLHSELPEFERKPSRDCDKLHDH